MNTDSTPMYTWNTIPWHKLEKEVFKLQKRIYQASKRGDDKLVHKLQKLLVNSWSARTLAVRRVTQDNQGRKTAGVDGIKSLSQKARLKLIGKLKLGTKAKPTRRVWIPKPGKEEKRPLGIPTIHDRALQALVKLALEPEWEAKFESNSYGFRPGRSCHDAIQAIFLCIKQKPKYILDADIAKCFDKINHEKLLAKLETYPKLRRQIRTWLKAGIMEGNKLFPSNEGTPQGGICSPILANIALHGLENMVKEIAESFDMRRANGKHQIAKSSKRNSISLIRYADDFVVLHEQKEAIYQCKEAISQWLKDFGLELKPNKTRITHTLNGWEENKPGFDFLGFRILQFKAGKCVSGKHKEKLLGFKTRITPSQEARKRHYKSISQIIDKYKGQAQTALITKLNPIIKGWCNYYKPFQSGKHFGKIYSLVYWKLWKWAKHRHPNKGEKWILRRYWRGIDQGNWDFSTNIGKEHYNLIKHHEISTNIGFVKVKGNKSPFDGDLIYWSIRMGRHPEMPISMSKLLKRQEGKCNSCGLVFKHEDVIETDHIIPTAAGGNNKYENLQLLHRHCHDKKTQTDLTAINSYKAEKEIKENYKWFKKMDWMWINDIPAMGK